MDAANPLGEARMVRAMRMTVVGFAWVWFLLALPVVTDAGMEDFFCCPLICLGLPTGAVWVASTLFSKFKVERRDRPLWWSVPALGLITVGLALTDYDLVLRVRLSEPALTEFAEAVRRGEADVDHTGPGRRVGLMWVQSVYTDGSEVYLVTTHQFLDRTCLAHLPSGPTDDLRFGPRYTHLTGSWYVYFDRF